MKVGIPLVKNYSAPLATMAYASAIDGAIQRKIRGKGVLRAGKGITLVIQNEDTDYIIKIITSLESCGVLIDEVNETVKQEIQKQEN